MWVDRSVKQRTLNKETAVCVSCETKSLHGLHILTTIMICSLRSLSAKPNLDGFLAKSPERKFKKLVTLCLMYQSIMHYALKCTCSAV